MFRQLTQAMSGATALSARVMARAMAVPADTALWARQTTSRKSPEWHSRNKVVLAAPFALLRDFSAGDDDVVPTLLSPPLDVLNAVIVSMGTMGVIYSVVLEVVPQFGVQQICTMLEQDATTGTTGWSAMLKNAGTSEGDLRRGDVGEIGRAHV